MHHELLADQGAAGATLRLAAAMRRQGHTVDVLGLEVVPRALPEPVRWLGFPWVAGHHMDRADVDVVDASTGDAWVWGTLRRAGRDRPLLVTRSHGLEHLLHAADLAARARAGQRVPTLGRAYWGGVRQWEVARSLRVADLALFVNEPERRYAVDRLRVPAHRTAVVSHGIGDHFLGLPAPRGDGAHDVGIAVLGSFEGIKGGRLAAETLGQVLVARPEVRASFLGTGAGAEVLAALPASTHGRVTVVPSYPNRDLPGLLEGHAIALALPDAEGFGIAVIEAMACGLVPVVSDAPGPARVVEHERTGLVVSRGRAADAATAVARLLDDPPRRLVLRRAAHARAQDFTWEAAARHQLGLYGEAMARRCEAAP